MAQREVAKTRRAKHAYLCSPCVICSAPLLELERGGASWFRDYVKKAGASACSRALERMKAPAWSCASSNCLGFVRLCNSR